MPFLVEEVYSNILVRMMSTKQKRKRSFLSIQVRRAWLEIAEIPKRNPLRQKFYKLQSSDPAFLLWCLVGYSQRSRWRPQLQIKALWFHRSIWGWLRLLWRESFVGMLLRSLIVTQSRRRSPQASMYFLNPDTASAGLWESSKPWLRRHKRREWCRFRIRLCPSIRLIQ